ncbi:MAG: histidinol dehydrogenase [Magnetococcales bacterium]|nr:histidinol dehydrogenase [Magnetococcales bacterium]NGZ28850.1 histidinol dehydrogenase [Magnetococcales bacterium]
MAVTPRRLNSQQADFEEQFQRLIHWEEGDLSAIEATVAQIIKRVRQEGDAAVLEYTHRFDRVALTPETLAFSQQEINAAWSSIPSGDLAALELAADRIREFHQWQMPPMGVQAFTDDKGAWLGQRLLPLKRVGLYVPGGLAAYPSSVLMNAIPAKVAGVQEMFMVVPTPDGVVNPLVLAAAKLAGVDGIFKVGGAQAVAALAYGTATIPAVEKIVGPGNIYVAMAKRQVFGQVGIDMIAGPSEILIIADGHNSPRWTAADLLSQAEHDRAAQSILLTNDAAFADAVALEVEKLLETLERRDICQTSWNNRGAIIITRDLQEACRLSAQVAPEHLELAVENPEELLPLVENAGAIFMGRYTPEPIGDYVAGPNHVLPTSGTARFSSPLGVYDFIKRSSLIRCTQGAFATIGPAASRLAACEGLTAHKLSIDLRLEDGS